MSYHSGDTICAIATAPSGAARGMVRVSGPDALAIVSRCFLPDDDSRLHQLKCACTISGQVRVALGADRGSANRPLTPPYPGTQADVPCDAFIWPNARSYTREPVVELHTLGSPALLEAVLAAVCRAGARLAEAGEFTLRAFLAGRIDLTQAEAVLGIIDARGSKELDAALVQLAGGLAGPLQKLRDELLQLLAELEAGLDFVEEDIEFVSPAEILRRLTAAHQLLAHVAEQMAARHTANRAQQVALLGPPNVGKSSLFNALVARYGTRSANQPTASAAALVSAQPGTTRDFLAATISLDGVSCELVDTAGFEERGGVAAQDSVRSSGRVSEIDGAAQAMAAECGARSTIRAHCIDASNFALSPRIDFERYAHAPASTSDIIVLTKVDLVDSSTRSPKGAAPARPVVRTSSRTGEGLEQLHALLRDLLANDQPSQSGNAVAATADRCRESIRLAREALDAARDTAQAGGGNELLAVEIRAALDEFGKVVGAVYTDDLLDRIFSTFCIGK